MDPKSWDWSISVKNRGCLFQTYPPKHGKSAHLAYFACLFVDFCLLKGISCSGKVHNPSVLSSTRDFVFSWPQFHLCQDQQSHRFCPSLGPRVSQQRFWKIHWRNSGFPVTWSHIQANLLRYRILAKRITNSAIWLLSLGRLFGYFLLVGYFANSFLSSSYWQFGTLPHLLKPNSAWILLIHQRNTFTGPRLRLCAGPSMLLVLPTKWVLS